MKSIKEYINHQLKSLVKEFDQIKASYRYDKLCETFYVQILPSEIYKKSEELQSRRTDILDEFLDLFPNESIVFLTEGNRIKMNEIEWCIKGKRFELDKFDSKALSYKDFNFEFDIQLVAQELSSENNYAIAA